MCSALSPSGLDELRVWMHRGCVGIPPSHLWGSGRVEEQAAVVAEMIAYLPATAAQEALKATFCRQFRNCLPEASQRAESDEDEDEDEDEGGGEGGGDEESADEAKKADLHRAFGGTGGTWTTER